MRILFLTNLLPYPLDNGGKIKTYMTLKALCSGNNQTDLVCFKEQVEDHNYQELDKICHNVWNIYWNCHCNISNEQGYEEKYKQNSYKTGV